jgi:hypothetical protein
MQVVEHYANKGKVLYYEGKPCRNCSGTTRYRMTRSCVACARLAARAVTMARRVARHECAIAALKRLGLR